MMGMLNTMPITLDPCEQHGSHSVHSLLEACGLLPAFVLDAHDADASNVDETLNAIKRAYGFPIDAISDVTISPVGMWQYEGDFDLAPYMICHVGTNAVQVMIYPYALVAIVDGSSTFCCRID